MKFLKNLFNRERKYTLVERKQVEDDDEGSLEYKKKYQKYFHRILHERYYGKGFWNTLEVSIFEKDWDTGEENKIGMYVREYGSMYNTFCPFVKDDKHYALYSSDYTKTEVMELPSCKKIAEDDSKGFCPVDFFVPNTYDHLGDPGEELQEGSFGFVAGCYWGDDSSWKIRYLDLSEIDKGIVKNEERFGYISMPCGDIRLKDIIDFDNFSLDDYQDIYIAQPIAFNLLTGKPSFGYYMYYAKDALIKDEEERKKKEELKKQETNE